MFFQIGERVPKVTPQKYHQINFGKKGRKPKMTAFGTKIVQFIMEGATLALQLESLQFQNLP